MIEKTRRGRSRSIALWLVERIGRKALVLAFLSLCLFLLTAYGWWTAANNEGTRADARIDATLFVIVVFLFLNVVAWFPCAFAHLRHLRRVQMDAIHYVPRLQSWKNWYTDGRIPQQE